MGLLFPGVTRCAICRDVIQPGEPAHSFPAFIEDPQHALYRYSDRSFHKHCFDGWPERERYVDLYLRRFSALRC